MASAAIFNWIGACGAGIQSSFAWTTFNQAAFLGNVAMRQNQTYQKKNYKITWVAMARDDIRSLMSISVNRLNNYIIVSALISGLSSTGVFSVSFENGNPKFLQEMFLMSMGMSVVFLMVAIMLGVKGQNAAFTHTIKLLIHEIRPENPADYNHDYMMQAQLVERDGLRGLFRIPGFMPKYEGWPKGAKKEVESSFPKTETSFDPGVEAKSTSKSSSSGVEEEGYRPRSDGFENLEGTGQSPTEQLWYLLKFAHFMRLWTPFDVYCKFSMSLGMVALGHGTTYFVLCKIDLTNMFFAVVCMLSPFLYFPMVVVSDNFRFPSKRLAVLGALLQLSGPMFGLIAVYARSRNDGSLIQAICVPMCFFSHSIFYMGVFTVAYNKSEDAKLPAFERDEEVLSDMIQEFEEAVQLERSTEENKEAVEGRADSEQDDQETWEKDARYTASSGPVEQTVTGASSFAAIGSKYGFPTDSELFEEQVKALGKNVKRTLRNALVVAVVMYLMLTVWGCRRMFDEFRFFIEMPVYPAAVVTSKWQINWNAAPLFRPHTITCAGPHLLLADRFHVYSVEDKTNLRKVEGCVFDERIVDLSARCEYSTGGVRCRPVVLLPRRDGDGYELRVCGHGKKDEIDIIPAEDVGHVSSYIRKSGIKASMMILSQKDELVQYRRSAKGEQWRPEGTLGKVVRSSLRSISATMDFLIEYHVHAVNTRSMNSVERINRWILPAGIGNLTSGCANMQVDEATILTYVGTPPDDLEPRLYDIKLPGLLEFRKEKASTIDTGNERNVHEDGRDKTVVINDQSSTASEAVMKFEGSKVSLLSTRTKAHRRSGGILQVTNDAASALLQLQSTVVDNSTSFDEKLAAAKRMKKCKRSCKPGWK